MTTKISSAIVVVTHELASAFLIADRMVLIDNGNIVAFGTKVEGELDYLQALTERYRRLE
jgi:ABC-type multidrug transport system ATPase subunit